MVTKPDPVMCAELLDAPHPVVVTIARNVDDPDLLCRLATHRVPAVRVEVVTNPAAPLETRLAVLDTLYDLSRPDELSGKLVKAARRTELVDIARHARDKNMRPLLRFVMDRLLSGADPYAFEVARSLVVLFEPGSEMSRCSVLVTAALLAGQLDGVVTLEDCYALVEGVPPVVWGELLSAFVSALGSVHAAPIKFAFAHDLDVMAVLAASSAQTVERSAEPLLSDAAAQVVTAGPDVSGSNMVRLLGDLASPELLPLFVADVADAWLPDRFAAAVDRYVAVRPFTGPLSRDEFDAMFPFVQRVAGARRALQLVEMLSGRDRRDLFASGEGVLNGAGGVPGDVVVAWCAAHPKLAYRERVFDMVRGLVLRSQVVVAMASACSETAWLLVGEALSDSTMPFPRLTPSGESSRSFCRVATELVDRLRSGVLLELRTAASELLFAAVAEGVVVLDVDVAVLWARASSWSVTVQLLELFDVDEQVRLVSLLADDPAMAFSNRSESHSVRSAVVQWALAADPRVRDLLFGVLDVTCAELCADPVGFDVVSDRLVDEFGTDPELWRAAATTVVSVHQPLDRFVSGMRRVFAAGVR